MLPAGGRLPWENPSLRLLPAYPWQAKAKMVTAAGNDNFEPSSKIVTFKVVIK
jgi:hypothetical protein